MKSPFQFLDAYTSADKDKFFGRDAEVKQLYKLVNQNRLTLVYGQSGTGKTSMVQCGLASRYKPVDWYPIFIRRGDDLNKSLRNKLAEALGDEPYESCVETIDEIYALHLRPVYLVFDQFEELFIMESEDKNEQTTFFKTIAEIVEAKLPCRIVLIMREEYLAHLYEFESIVPTLLNARLRVETMGFQKIAEVIRNSCERFNISFEDPKKNISQIINNLKGEKALIQLPYLQVFLDLLYKEDYERTFPHGTTDELPALTFTTEEIEEFGMIENVLHRFLKEQKIRIQQFLEQRNPEVSNKTISKLLDAFVTSQGTKRPIHYEKLGNGIVLEKDVQRLLPVDPETLKLGLDALESRRLLRSDDTTYELAHDSLAALIEADRSGEQRQLNEALVNLQSSYRIHQTTGDFLSQRQLSALEPYLDQLVLSKAEKQFFRDSKKKLNRKRRRNVLLFSLIAVSLLGLTVWGWVSAAAANNSARIAMENQQKAEESQKEAEENLILAQENGAAALKAEEAFNNAKAEADSMAKRAYVAQVNFQKQEAKTRRVQRELRAASLKIHENIMKSVDFDIKDLNYQKAATDLYSAASLNVDKPAVAKGMMEVAYFYAESNQFARADSIARSIGDWYGKSPPVYSNSDTLLAFRNYFKQLDEERYEELVKRYYPELVTVAGGGFKMGCDPERIAQHEKEMGLKPETLKCSEASKVHEVSVDSFQIAKTETTNWQFHLFVEATDYKACKYLEVGWIGSGLGNIPVSKVTWNEAVLYSDWLSGQQRTESAYEMDSIYLKRTRIPSQNNRIMSQPEVLPDEDGKIEGHPIPFQNIRA